MTNQDDHPMAPADSHKKTEELLLFYPARCSEQSEDDNMKSTKNEVIVYVESECLPMSRQNGVASDMTGKVEKYGLAALVVGGASAVAAEFGWFKWIWKVDEAGTMVQRYGSLQEIQP